MDPYRWPNEFMSKQVHLNPKMRVILIDWLTEVAQEFQLGPQTFFQAVNIIDRYLEAKVVPRKKFQLLGVAAMYHASCNDVEGPNECDFSYICDNQYRDEQVDDMVISILQALRLEYNLLLAPTTFTYLTSFLDAIGAGHDEEVAQVCTYLLEVAAIYAVTAIHAAHEITAAAVEVALRICDRNMEPYPDALAAASGVSRTDVLPCAAALAGLWDRVRQLPEPLATYTRFCSTNGDLCRVEGPLLGIKREAERLGVEL